MKRRSFENEFSYNIFYLGWDTVFNIKRAVENLQLFYFYFTIYALSVGICLSTFLSNP